MSTELKSRSTSQLEHQAEDQVLDDTYLDTRLIRQFQAPEIVG